MPANPKYLTTSKWQRFAKLSASLVGSFLVTASLHVVVAAYTSPKVVLMGGQYTFFMLWAGLMFVPYLMENGWKCWLLFGGLTTIFMVITWFRLPM